MRYLLSLLLFLMSTVTLLAQEQEAPAFQKFTNEDLGISLSYPSDFKRILNPPTSEVILLLNGPADGYPTINVIKMVGDPQIAQKSLYQLGIDVVDSYRAVGLIDAEISHSEKRQIAGREVFSAKVSYLIRGSPVAAAVFVVPTLHHYFIFTFIDSAAAYPTTVQGFEKIMKTVTLRDPAPIAPPKEDGAVLVYWLIGVLVLLGGAWLLSVLLKKPSAKR